jgi:molybdate transport system ATP-binding protein
MGLVKYLTFLNKRRQYKGWPRSLSLWCEKKVEKHLGYKKNIGYFSTAMTDLFQMIASNKWFYRFFDSIGTHPPYHKKIVSQWLKLVRLNHLKTPFKILSVGQQRLALIIRVKAPLLILDEAVEGLDDENVAVIAQLITLLSQQTNI